MAQRRIPGGPFVNEEGTFEARIPGYVFFDSGVAAASAVTIYRPNATESAGNWTASDGTTYGAVGEAVRDDSNYCLSALNPSADAIAFSFGSVPDPGVHTGHTVRYAIMATGTMDMVVRWKEDSSTIKSWTHSPAPTEWTEFEQTLSEAEAATITDYSLLRIEVQAA